jgi:hypothetical protein
VGGDLFIEKGVGEAGLLGLDGPGLLLLVKVDGSLHLLIHYVIDLKFKILNNKRFKFIRSRYSFKTSSKNTSLSDTPFYSVFLSCFSHLHCPISTK